MAPLLGIVAVRKGAEVSAATCAASLGYARTSTVVGPVEVGVATPTVPSALKAPAIDGVTYGVHEEVYLARCINTDGRAL